MTVRLARNRARVLLSSEIAPLWHPDSYLRKGLAGASVVGAGSFAAAMAGAAQTNINTSPVRSAIQPGFSTAYNGTPAYYVVPTHDHPRQPVFVYKTTGVPSAWPSGSEFPGGTAYPAEQQAYCVSVPVPLGADGSAFEKYYGKLLQDPTFDHHVTIYDPWHDEMWDFEQFFCNNTGANPALNGRSTWLPPSGYPVPADGYYYACDQPGYIGPLLGTSVRNGDGIMRGSPGGTHLPDGSNPTVAASAISLMAGTITIDDRFSDVIKHMLQVSINCGNGHIAPAWSDDVTPHRTGLFTTASGASDFTYQSPEGAIYRIDPTWTIPPEGDLISAHADLAQVGLGGNHNQVITQWHRMIWAAMRDYGLLVTDFGSNALQVTTTSALDTPYCKYTTDQFNARMAAISPGGAGSPGGPYGCAPWGLIQQVQYPF